ncbi:MAG TPA: hypothetical protein VH518_23780 [Tepidisphaeraceae bacterium]
MAGVSFVLKTRGNFVGANAFGANRILVRVPVLSARSTVNLLCDEGSVEFGAIKLIGAATAFDAIDPNPSARFNTGQGEPGGHFGTPGQEVISASVFGLKNIKVIVEVVVERRYNTAAVPGQKGPNGRPMAIPDFRARARTTITCDYTHSVEGWRKGPDGWSAFESDLPPGTRSEEGLFGDRLFLTDAKCEAVEPPEGTLYNNFEDVVTGTFEKVIT